MPTAIGDAISTFFSRYGMLLLLGAVMIGLVLLMILPQRKQRKQVEKMLSEVKPGDHIRTIGGFFGVVDSIDKDVVIIKAGPNKQRIAIAREAIAQVGSNTDVENTMKDTIVQ